MSGSTRIKSEVEHDRAIRLRAKIIDARDRLKLSQKEFAAQLGFTPQYLCDIEHGRRLGSVEFVDRVCDRLGASSRERREWHRAGAQAHGWVIE